MQNNMQHFQQLDSISTDGLPWWHALVLEHQAAGQARLRKVVLTDNSACVRWFGYHRASKSLTIQFVNGGRYRYDRVPRRVARQLRGAPSRGRFFNYAIKAKYPTWKLA